MFLLYLQLLSTVLPLVLIMTLSLASPKFLMCVPAQYCCCPANAVLHACVSCRFTGCFRLTTVSGLPAAAAIPEPEFLNF
jgi:hypothetical protein